MSAVYPLFPKELVRRSMASACVAARVPPWLAQASFGGRRATAARRTFVSDQKGRTAMTCAMKPLSFDPNRIRGMLERMIVSHYENN